MPRKTKAHKLAEAMRSTGSVMASMSPALRKKLGLPVKAKPKKKAKHK